jgi:hypothetical protein
VRAKRSRRGVRWHLYPQIFQTREKFGRVAVLFPASLSRFFFFFFSDLLLFGWHFFFSRGVLRSLFFRAFLGSTPSLSARSGVDLARALRARAYQMRI